MLTLRRWYTRLWLWYDEHRTRVVLRESSLHSWH